MAIRTRLSLILPILVVPTVSCADPAPATPKPVDTVAEEVFAAVQSKYPPSASRCFWRNATLLWGIEQVYSREPSKRQAWKDFILDSVDTMIGDDGLVHPEFPDVDFISCGINLLFAYRETGDPRYLTAAESLYAYMMQNFYKAKDGAISHVSSPETEYRGFVELWVDSDFLLLSFLARLAEATGDPAFIQQAALQAVLHIQHLMDTQARLHVHGWAQRDNRGRLPPWADPITGRNPVFWGRGNGWVMAGLAEVLLRLPPSDPSYPFILESFQQSAAGLLAVREPSGMWKVVLEDPSLPGNVDETSGSSLIAYGMETGVRMGWLDPAAFGEVAEQARPDLLARWQNPNLVGVSAGTSISDDPADYLTGFDLNSKYGEGAFLGFLSLFIGGV